MMVAVLIALLILPLLYKRYVPVFGARRISSVQQEREAVLVDVRDFHEVQSNPVISAIHIPLPYLARHHYEIPQREVVVVVSDRILRNLSIRQLKKHGYDVKGYWCIHDQPSYVKISV